MLLVKIFLACLVCWQAVVLGRVGTEPVLTPGGRYDVHGWFIMPMDHEQNDTSTSYTVNAWFSHHVPEFWTNSPHNFQIILKGVLTPNTHIPHTPALPMPFPLPPKNDLEVYQYTFTPPPPFSLNDLLLGDITQLNGVFYNGSFHSSYERIPQSLATLSITELTTVVYLEEYQPDEFKTLRYLSYPRNLKHGQSSHFYFAHAIRAQPDFDHQVHGTLDQCSRSLSEVKLLPGAAWEVTGIPNTLEHRLMPGQMLSVQLVSDSSVTCTVTVLENLTCMIGPGFMDNC